MEKVNLFIVGAGKSGTTALANQLSMLDEVYLPQVKEPHYFAMYNDKEWAEVDHFGSTYVSNIEYYKNIYKAHRHENYLIDASTSYLHRTGTAERIHEYNRDAKIIILLRNPVDRAYSHYLMSKRVGHTRSDFMSAIENEYLETDTGVSYYIKIGLYSTQLEEYLQVFPEEAVKVILYEDFSNNSEETFKDLLSFLGITNTNDDYAFLKTKHNETLLPRSHFISALAKNKRLSGLAKNILGPVVLNSLRNILYTKKNVKSLSSEERKQCLAYFYDDIKKLESMLKVDLSAWYIPEE